MKLSELFGLRMLPFAVLSIMVLVGFIVLFVLILRFIQGGW
jgi:hypothetical protein